MMRRTTITLPERMANALEREARRRQTSASEVVRLALKKHLNLTDPEDGPRKLAFMSLGNSGRNAIGENMEELLAGDLPNMMRDAGLDSDR
jgi:Arc/MetJ-type ribon-helix-helix transcriptional regulator